MQSASPTKEEKLVAKGHYVASFIGGFLGVYPILTFLQFGSAQTTNWIELVVDLLGGEFLPALFRFIGAVFFATGIVVATILLKRVRKKILQFLALGIDLAAAVVLVFLPTDVNPIVGLYPTFLAMSLHWCAFNGAYGFVSAPIFSTNNFKQMISAYTEVVANHDKSYRLKGNFYAVTLLSFYIGVASEVLLWRPLGNYSLFFLALPLAVECFLVIRMHKKKV